MTGMTKNPTTATTSATATKRESTPARFIRRPGSRYCATMPDGIQHGGDREDHPPGGGVDLDRPEERGRPDEKQPRKDGDDDPDGADQHDDGHQNVRTGDHRRVLSASGRALASLPGSCLDPLSARPWTRCASPGDARSRRGRRRPCPSEPEGAHDRGGRRTTAHRRSQGGRGCRPGLHTGRSGLPQSTRVPVLSSSCARLLSTRRGSPRRVTLPVTHDIVVALRLPIRSRGRSNSESRPNLPHQEARSVRPASCPDRYVVSTPERPSRLRALTSAREGRTSGHRMRVAAGHRHRRSLRFGCGRRPGRQTETREIDDCGLRLTPRTQRHRRLHRAPPPGPRGTRGGAQAPGHVHRLDRPARPHALPLGDHRQRRRRGARRGLHRHPGHPRRRRLDRGARRRPRHPRRHRAPHRAVRGRGRLHQAPRGRQVRRCVVCRDGWPARCGRLRRQRPLGPPRRRGRPRRQDLRHELPSGRARHVHRPQHRALTRLRVHPLREEERPARRRQGQAGRHRVAGAVLARPADLHQGRRARLRGHRRPRPADLVPRARPAARHPRRAPHPRHARCRRARSRRSSSTTAASPTSSSSSPPTRPSPTCGASRAPAPSPRRCRCSTSTAT